MTEQYLSTNINAPRRTVTVAASTALNEDADLVIVNTTGLGAAPTITLPDARVVDGRTITIKVPVATVGSGGQNVIVDGLDAQTIDGALTVTIAIDQTALQVQSDNANWRIIGLTDADSGGEIIFGSLFLDSASPSLTIGNGTGSPELILNKSDAGTAEFNMQVAGVTRWDWLFNATEDLLLERRDAGGVLVDVPLTFDIAAGNASFANSILQGGAVVADGVVGATNFIFGDGTGSAGITGFGDAAAGTVSFQATDTSSVSVGAFSYAFANNTWSILTNGAARVRIDSNGLTPQTTGVQVLGITSRAWGPSFINQISYAVVVVGDGGTDTLGAEKLVQATAPTAATTLNLPAAVVGDEYFLDLVDTTATVLIVAAAGDAINGGAAGGTATIAAGNQGLYHIYAVDANNWRLHGAITTGPASA